MKTSMLLSLADAVRSALHVLGVGGVVGATGVALLVLLYAWHRALYRAVKPVTAPASLRESYPSITVIRPVRGKDVGAAENFAAALDTGYPGEVETLFVFDDEEDPGLPVARGVATAHRTAERPGQVDVLVAGSPPSGMTGKLHAMMIGQRFARGELVAFGDSDTRPDRRVLRGVVDALLDAPEAGSAFAPILVDKAPRAVGDVLYALMQNAMYAPLAAWAAGKSRTLPFIMGQLMVFRREALEAIGGVQVAKGQLVDDMYIGKRVHEAGFTNVMSRPPLHITTGGMTLREFIPVYRRWMMFSRNGLPLSFTWRQWLQGVAFFIALVAMVAGLVTGHALAALLPALAIAAQTVSFAILNESNGAAAVPVRWAWVPTVFFLLSPFVLLANELRRDVLWRGRSYTVNVGAELAPSLAMSANVTPIKRPALIRPSSSNAQALVGH